MKHTLLYLFATSLVAIGIGGCGGERNEAEAGSATAANVERGGDVGAPNDRHIRRVVDRTIRATMDENRVPGMAVGVTVNGRHHVYSYGLASKADGRRVSRRTIFEVGSVSKTFTAVMAAYALERGRLSLSDPASEHLPALAGSSFDQISMLDLATYTAGGLPLQFPAEVTDESHIIPYFRQWQPTYPVGTQRLYSNPSVGLFGRLAAASLGEPFDSLMQRRIFPMLGLRRTYIDVPAERMRNYAWGYTADDQPTRVNPGPFDSETYGVKSTAADMIRFVEAQMDSRALDPALRRAITTTHSGYDQARSMTQGLGWEMYAYPTALDALQIGNSASMLLEPNAVTPHEPPLPPQRDFLANKTGSTDGFGAYVAFVPSKQIGVVLLANKKYPIPARVDAAYQILTALERASAGA